MSTAFATSRKEYGCQEFLGSRGVVGSIGSSSFSF